MTEEPFDEPAGEAAEEAADEAFDETPDEAPEQPAEEPAATGHPAVDEVLRSLDALGNAPVDEHVAVFESAHEQLRRTLQGAGDDQD